uniref:Uncharacterized protein n=1 Tax=Marmota marmota marmota TaxID=9994 RepID=A0A8C5Z748_MARMA
SSAPCRSTLGAWGEGSGVPGRARTGAGDPFGEPPGDASGESRRKEVGLEGADSPAAPRDPQLGSKSVQLRAGRDAAPAGGGCAALSSPSEELFSPALPPRLQPPSSAGPAASSAPSLRRFF